MFNKTKLEEKEKEKEKKQERKKERKKERLFQSYPSSFLRKSKIETGNHAMLTSKGFLFLSFPFFF